jgi:acetyl esterase/lipase
MLAPEGERPAAVLLYSPAVDIRPVSALFKMTPEQAAAISPAALPIDNLPPTVIFHSRDDDIVPIAMVRAFWLKALNAHRVIAMYEYVGLPHTFPRMKEPDVLIGRSPYDDLLAKTFEFLDRLPEMKAAH